MSLVELNGVGARLGGRDVLSGVKLALQPGEMVALCGPNGAGKTSVLRAAAGILPITAGEILIGGTPLPDVDARARARRIAYLPQERRIAWNMPAVEVAALGAPFLATGDALARALTALEQVDGGHLAHRGVAEMSGGERARILLARALVADAPAMLVDEPIAGLDPDAQLLVLERLRAHARDGGGVMVSLHDLSLAARYADRVIVLNGGKIVADAPPLEALAPSVLAEVFGVRGRWVHADDEPQLVLRRA